MTTKTAPKPSDAAVAVFKKEAGVLVTSAPQGVSSIAPEDLMLPQILLMHGQSQMVQKEKKQIGTFVNSLTKKSYESVEFVPLGYTKWIEGLRNEGEEVVVEFKTFDPFDTRLEGRDFFWKDGEKPTARAVAQYICMVEGKPALLQFQGTSYTASKKLNTFIVLSEKDIYANKYKLTSGTRENKKNKTYWYKDVELIAALDGDELAQAAKMFEAFGKKVTAVDHVEEEATT